MSRAADAVTTATGGRLTSTAPIFPSFLKAHHWRDSSLANRRDATGLEHPGAIWVPSMTAVVASVGCSRRTALGGDPPPKCQSQQRPCFLMLSSWLETNPWVGDVCYCMADCHVLFVPETQLTVGGKLNFWINEFDFKINKLDPPRQNEQQHLHLYSLSAKVNPLWVFIHWNFN